MESCGAVRRGQHKRQRALEAGAVPAFLPVDPTMALREGRSFERPWQRSEPGRAAGGAWADTNNTPRELVEDWSEEDRADYTQKNDNGKESWLSHRAPDGIWCLE